MGSDIGNNTIMRLSINLNKIALLRNQRDLELPSVTAAARTVLSAGAHGITVHPRPDERHTRVSDVHALKQVVAEFDAELNVEGNPQPEFLELIAKVRPHQVTLVPDDPSARTSDHGWDVAANMDFLADVIGKVHNSGARVSLFLDYDADMSMAAKTGTDAIELYTEPYAQAFASRDTEILNLYAQAAQQAHQFGLQVHAGHDLNLENLSAFFAAVPEILEVSIGHAFTAEALWLGIEETTKQYLDITQQVNRI